MMWNDRLTIMRPANIQLEGFYSRIPTKNGMLEIIIGEKKYTFWVDSETSSEFGWGLSGKEVIFVNTPPSKEERQALDAVKKAEESLKAAKKTLEAVKNKS